MNEKFLTLAQGLSDLLNVGRIVRLDAGNLGEDERGWSGAEVRRVQVFYESGTEGSVIMKQTALKERCAMKSLTEKGHRFTPASFSLNLTSDSPEWMCMEDLGKPQPPSGDDPMWMSRAAEALASIHSDHMGKGAEMPWLPHADAAYWRFITTQISIDHFERKMKESREFRDEFGKYLPLLRDKAELFARDMTALYREGNCLTLTHGDIQTVDGAHIYSCSGHPRIIDFGWCHYAPFYVDLASYFTFEEAKLYYDALLRKGIELKYSDFDERLRTAFRYNGFIYFCPSVINWGSGPTERTGKRLLQMLRIILTGEFPERKIGYSQAIFNDLLQMHQNGSLAKT